MSKGLDREHADALERYAAMMGGVVDPREEVLPEGISNTLEEFARELSHRMRVDLSLVLPLALTAVSGATEGAYDVVYPVGGGHWVTNPVVIQSVILASSGVGKSTVLEEVSRLLKSAVESARVRRGAWVADRMAALEGVAGVDPARALEVMRAGACPQTITGTGTPEALRNALATNGSHLVLMSAEADMFAEISKYSERSDGSLTALLNGWDGADLIVNRAKDGVISAPGATLPFCVLMQPEAFLEATGSHHFLYKGLLHRTLITSGGRTGSVEVTEESLFSDAGIGAGLTATGLALEDAMRRIAVRGAPHRAWMAARGAWDRGGAGEHGVPRPEPEPRIALRVGTSARSEMVAVMRIRAELMRMVSDQSHDNPGPSQIEEPLVTRLASHVLRIAAALTLVEDPDATEVAPEFVSESCTRIMPWLWSHWHMQMTARATDAQTLMIEATIRENPKGSLRTPDVLIGRAVAGLTKARSGASMMEGGPSAAFTSSEIISRAVKMFSSSRRDSALRKRMRDEFEIMLAQGDLLESVPNPRMAGTHLYRLTPAGVAWANAER